MRGCTPGLLCGLPKVVPLLLQVLVCGCQRGMPQNEVPNLMELICTLQHALQVVLVPTSRTSVYVLSGVEVNGNDACSMLVLATATANAAAAHWTDVSKSHDLGLLCSQTGPCQVQGRLLLELQFRVLRN